MPDAEQPEDQTSSPEPPPTEPPKKKYKKPWGTPNPILTDAQMRFVACYVKNATQAARDAGLAEPAKEGQMLMQNPFVHAAIMKKQEEIRRASARKIGHELCDVDVIGEVTEIARAKKQTGNVRLRAYELLAKIKGLIVDKREDVSNRLKGKSPDEMDFIAHHRRDPVDAIELSRFIEERDKPAKGRKVQ